MSSLITSQARTNELVRFSSFNTDGFTPFITPNTLLVVPTHTIDVVLSSERPESATKKVQIASRPPVVPQHTVSAIEELGKDLVRIGMPGIAGLSILVFPVVGACVLLFVMVMAGPRIARWYMERRMAIRNLKTGRPNILMGPGGERRR